MNLYTASNNLTTVLVNLFLSAVIKWRN